MREELEPKFQEGNRPALDVASCDAHAGTGERRSTYLKIDRLSGKARREPHRSLLRPLARAP